MKRRKEQGETCSNCGKPAKVVHETYFWNDADLPVVLKNAELIKCRSCGNIDLVIHRMNQFMRTLALAVILKPHRMTAGELRFLRKHAGLTGAALAELIRVDKTTLSKWENGADPIGDQSDRLIRAVILGSVEGLEGQLRTMIERFPQISRKAHRVAIQMDPSTLTYEYAMA